MVVEQLAHVSIGQAVTLHRPPVASPEQRDAVEAGR